jgi:hypothetical protein
MFYLPYREIHRTLEKVNFGTLGMLTKNMPFDVCQSPSEMEDYEILVQDADWLRFCSLLCLCNRYSFASHEKICHLI